MDSCKSGVDTHAEALPEGSCGQISDGHDHDNTLNVLILGETDVGKSTWINSITNYVAYKSLDAAQLSNDPKWTIPSRFTISDDDYNEQTIYVGPPGGNEENEIGEANTRFPRSYKFMWGEKKLRFINTPGIGDSRGLQQDKINLANIFRYIEMYPIENLSAVIILMKPNRKRFTPAFTEYISELFTRLPKSCAENMLFGFTGTRPFCYRIGETLAPLRQFLAAIEEHQNVSLKISKDTAFCFDNEAFRFLFASLAVNGITFSEDDRKNYAASWDQSVKETQRFLNRVSKSTPHDTTDIIALNEARQCISMLSKPLVLISDMIEVTLQEYIAEKEEIIRIAAMFGAFLKQSAIMPFNDAVEKYIELSIQQAENLAEMTRNPADIEHMKTLREWLTRYKQKKHNIEIGEVEGCTASEVKGYFQELLNLKHTGHCIREMFEGEKRVMEDQKKHMRSGAQSHSARNQPSASQGSKSWNSRIFGKK